MGSTLPPSVLPDISPTRGEISRHLRLCPTFNAEDWRSLSCHLISPLVGEMAGRPEGRATERRALI
ncbi:protein of unknown function [Aminobacter niigataensis]|nr:protein of unknown function [Aminobacter niigataensis]